MKSTKELIEQLAHSDYTYGSGAPTGSQARSLYEHKKESFIAGYKACLKTKNQSEP